MKIKTGLLLFFNIIFFCNNLLAYNNKPIKKDFYQIKVYHFINNEQVKSLDLFLQNAYLPALHRLGLANIGVFKNIGIDTAADKTMYVWIPMRSLDQLTQIDHLLATDTDFSKDGDTYLSTAFDAPAFTRIETIILQAFIQIPHFKKPALQGAITERIYELRSYEAASEKLYQQKVHMFNEGGEINLFNRLGFNACFYGEVLSGSRMPNLMYMTSFDDINSRNEHWKTFSADSEWKKLSALPQYQHTVSKADIILLHPTVYSEL